jgi:hypothetical protein
VAAEVGVVEGTVRNKTAQKRKPSEITHPEPEDEAEDEPGYGMNRDAQSAPPPITIDPTSGMMIQVIIWSQVKAEESPEIGPGRASTGRCRRAG